MFEARILKDRCKGCGLCLLFCKERALCTSLDINELGYFPVEPSQDRECMGCRNCYMMCPEGIIEIFRKK